MEYHYSVLFERSTN